MTSPRKFAEKIALIQQKQAEGDVAFKTIICEVGEAKQVKQKSQTKRHDVKLIILLRFSELIVFPPRTVD